MDMLKEQTVGQMVVDDYRKANVFKQFGIDFCCRGNKTIETVCKEHQINPDKLLTALAEVDKEEMPSGNYNHWSLNSLVDYIVNNHHQYLRDNLPEIKFYAKTVEKIHGDVHRELLRIYVALLKLSDEIMTHMDQEEELLFPFIKRLGASKINGNRDDQIDSSELIDMMQYTHKKEIWNILATIRGLSNNYQLSTDATKTYRVFYERLALLDENMHKHMHLENNILYPKALDLSQEFT